jgi:hypothetical protein
MQNNMPNFLGIGSVRGGSTWLWSIIRSHPDFYLPSKRKEIQFFTRHYNRGENWYRSLFLNSKTAPKFQGEFTPGYLTAPKAPERIKSLESVEKFVLILRSPISRAYSHFKWHLRVTAKNIDFKTFCKNVPKLAIKNGMYFKYISKYLEHFERDQFLILIYEEVTLNPEIAIRELGSFFDVDETLFMLSERKNESIIPKHRKFFNLAHKVSQYLRSKNIDFIPNFLIAFGLKKIFGNENNKIIPYLTFHEQKELYEIYRDDIKNLETLINRPLNIWTDDLDDDVCST